MSEWQQHPVYTREDGSYVITGNGYPCHVPHDGEWAGLWEEIHAWALSNPGHVTSEPCSPEPTPEESRQARIVEIQARLAAILGDISLWSGEVADIMSLAAVERRDYTPEELYRLDEAGSWIAELRREVREGEAEMAALEEAR